METVFRDVCVKFDSKLIQSDGEKDHVHLLVLYPPQVAISSLVNSLKRVSSRILRKNFKVFQERCCGDKAAL